MLGDQSKGAAYTRQLRTTLILLVAQATRPLVVPRSHRVKVWLVVSAAALDVVEIKLGVPGGVVLPWPVR